MTKKWQIYETNEHIQKQIEELEKRENINPLLATILVNRNMTEPEKLRMFLHPTRKDFHDPFLMPDMKRAVDRIKKAIENKEKVIIFGDYDADGITSITVLKSFLQDNNLHVDYYIPNRLDEGYGLNKPAIKKIAEEQGFAEDGYRVISNCGKNGAQEVPHLHFHLLAGKQLGEKIV